MSYVAVRVRGHFAVRREIDQTLVHLRLDRPNHAVVVPKNDSYEGMLRRSRDWVAYGEIDAATLEAMLRGRARLAGDKPLTDEYVQKHSSHASIEALAKAVASGSAKVTDVEGLKPVFRLNPPRRGYGGNKRHYPLGALGSWGPDINGLIRRMV